MESTTAPLATNMPTLVQDLGAAVANRAALHEARVRLVARVCGRVDGNAANRIAETVINFVNARTIREKHQPLSLVS
jgi:hypothetical protein